MLETRGQVDGLAGGERRVGLVDDHLARLDPDPGLEPELPNVLEDPEACSDRAIRVVLVGLRDPERGHDRVAGEFLHRAAVGLDAAGDAVEEARDAAPCDLGVFTGEKLGRANEIGKKNRRQLALHAQILGTEAPVTAGPRGR